MNKKHYVSGAFAASVPFRAKGVRNSNLQAQINVLLLNPSVPAVNAMSFQRVV